jgi:hypothetical protein
LAPIHPPFGRLLWSFIYFEILFQFLLFIIHLKSWFKFEYLNQSSKVPDLKRSQKVDLILSYFKIEFKFGLKIFKI